MTSSTALNASGSASAFAFRTDRAVRLAPALALLTALMATPAQAVEVFICWIGNGGYTMTGRMVYPDTLAGQRFIGQADVTEFEITGYFEGGRIGAWSLDQRTPATSWLLRYDARLGIFPTEGLNGLYQMWNANGFVDDCGTPGFGFNSGNGGQDVCIDDTYIASSTIDWDTPIVGLADEASPLCDGPALIGALPMTPRPAG